MFTHVLTTLSHVSEIPFPEEHKPHETPENGLEQERNLHACVIVFWYRVIGLKRKCRIFKRTKLNPQLIMRKSERNSRTAVEKREEKSGLLTAVWNYS